MTTPNPTGPLPPHIILPASASSLAQLAASPWLTTRKAMANVRCTIAADGSYSLSATNGRVLGVLTGQTITPTWGLLTMDGSAEPSHGDAYIPATQLATITKSAAGRKDLMRVRLAPPGQPCRIDVPSKDAVNTWGIDAAEGQHPDLAAVMPKTEPIATIKVNPELLARLLEVCAAIGLDGPNTTTIEIHPGEATPIVVRCGGADQSQSFVGLAMPMTK